MKRMCDCTMDENGFVDRRNCAMHYVPQAMTQTPPNVPIEIPVRYDRNGCKLRNADGETFAQLSRGFAMGGVAQTIQREATDDRGEYIAAAINDHEMREAENKALAKSLKAENVDHKLTISVFRKQEVIWKQKFNDQQTENARLSQQVTDLSGEVEMVRKTLGNAFRFLSGEMVSDGEAGVAFRRDEWFDITSQLRAALNHTDGKDLSGGE